jgi:hypothetical protein
MTATTEALGRRRGEDPAAHHAVAMAYDADVFRAFLEVSVQTLPSAVMARPGMIERIMAAAEGGPLLIPGPNREELLDLAA